MTTLGTWPLRRARINPYTAAFIEDGRSLTYGELAKRVDRLAAGLQEAGVGHGDRVAFLGRNCTACAELLFAANRIGAIFVPLNTRLSPDELAYIVGDSTPKVFVWSEPFGELVNALGQQADLGHCLSADSAAYDDLLTDAAGRSPPEVAMDDVAMIQYTSGTSGNPKGVMLSSTNLSWNTFSTLIDTDLVGSDVALVNAPMFHTATLNQVVLTTFIKGGTSILVSKFDPVSTLKMIEEYGVAYMFGVPTMFAGMTHVPEWETSDLSSIRLLTCGGAPVPASLTATYRARGLAFQQGYGLTEACPGLTFLRADQDHAPDGATGTPSFWVDVRVVEPGGEIAAPGTEGEIQGRGRNIMVGYWNNPDATADAIVDGGWLRTGDIAYVDDEGCYHVVDRLKDMIISGGENIYPAEVEKAISAHPAVAESAVIGVADETWGEVGRALVVLRDDATATEQDILGSLDGHLARYKIPRSVIFIDELPHNATGKLVKKRIPEQYRR